MWAADDSWKDYAAHPDQFAGTRMVRVIDGSADGARLLQAWTPAGVAVDIHLDRGLDLGDVRVKGVPLGWVGPSGPQPRYMYESEGFGWRRTFQGGLLTTCGLSHVGNPAWRSNRHNLPPSSPDMAQGEHGRISHQSAQLTKSELLLDDDPKLVIAGKIREAAIYSDCLELRRVIEIPLYRNEITLRDEVANVGALPARHEMLYHVNLGYPLVSETATVSTQDSGRSYSEHIAIMQPQAREVVDEWHVDPGNDGFSKVLLTNSEIESRFELSYSAASLPIFLLWKLQRTRSNALGFAPRSPENRFLEPDEVAAYELRFAF